jgi:DNA repair protein RadC
MKYTTEIEKKIKKYKRYQQKLITLSEELHSVDRYRISAQGDAISFIRATAPLGCEAVFAVYLDAKNRVIDYCKESEGTLTQSLLYPREIIKRALRLNALSIVICHNHPSGDPMPSENDRKITRKLLFACLHMELTLLDHVVIGKGEEYFSFYEQGFIASYNSEFANMGA